MRRPRAFFRLVLRSAIYSVAFGTPSAVVFALVSGWQSWGSYWPTTEQYIARSAFTGALFSFIAGLIMGLAMVVSIVVSFRRIEDRRYFQLLLGLTPIYFIILALLLFTSGDSAGTYFSDLLYGPPWIKYHFMAFVIAVAGAALLCRVVARKYASEVSPRKRKRHA